MDGFVSGSAKKITLISCVSLGLAVFVPVIATGAPAPLAAASTAPNSQTGTGTSAAQKLAAFSAVMGREMMRQRQEDNALAKKFAALSLANAFTPAGLTSKANIDASRASVAKYLDLIKERDAAAQRTHDTHEKMIMQADLAPEDRTSALAGFKAGAVVSAQLSKEMSAVQRELIAAAIRLFDFAESKLGKIKLVKGQFEFANDADFKDFAKLHNALAKIIDREDQVSQRVLQHQRTQEQKAARVLK